MAIVLLSVLVAASLVALLFLLTRKPSHDDKPSNLPPGSFGWPLLGETLEYIRMYQQGTEETFMRSRMEKYDKRVFKTSLLGGPTAVFWGSAGNKFLFSNENKLLVAWLPRTVRALLGKCLMTTVGDEAKKVRRLLMNFFDPDSLQRYTAIMDRVTQEHFKTNWEGRKEVTVYPLVKIYTFELACRIFMSIDNPEKITKLGHEFNAFLRGIVSLPLNFPGTNFYRGARAGDTIRREIKEIIKQRRVALENKTVSPTQDVLTYLLVNEDETGQFMTETEIANNILLLLFAGSDTSSSTLSMLMKYLTELPQVYEKVFKEQKDIAMTKGQKDLLQWEDIKKMKYSWNVVCEVLRLSPPATASYKEAIVDFNYAGYTIPKGWKLSSTIFSTHKDPSIFPNPNNFDPSRFEGDGPMPYTHVPFAGGVRMCLGKEFAKIQILVFLHNVVKRFKWEALCPDEKIQNDPMVAPSKGLPISLRSLQS